ncbi:MAG: hypothetical protein D6814_02895 [Calditrichaeota bacterium]|nr:MAG: hypothetical protein D6814_02895 [Calditrichota bacterium]
MNEQVTKPQITKLNRDSKNSFWIIMKTLKLVIGLSFSLAALAASPMMTKKEFTREFVKAISLEIKDADFAIVSDLRIHASNFGDHEINIYLDNSYDTYMSNQKPLAEIFHEQIESIKKSSK